MPSVGKKLFWKQRINEWRGTGDKETNLDEFFNQWKIFLLGSLDSVISQEHAKGVVEAQQRGHSPPVKQESCGGLKLGGTKQHSLIQQGSWVSWVAPKCVYSLCCWLGVGRKGRRSLRQASVVQQPIKLRIVPISLLLPWKSIFEPCCRALKPLKAKSSSNDSRIIREKAPDACTVVLSLSQAVEEGKLLFAIIAKLLFKWCPWSSELGLTCLEHDTIDLKTWCIRRW